MADIDMAEDEKAAKPEEAATPATTSSVPEASSPSDKPLENDAAAPHDPAAGSPSRRPPADEWTASDSRGPLERADGDHATSIEPPSGGPAATEQPPADAMHASDVSAPPAAASETARPVETASATTAATPARWPIAAALIVGAVIGAGSAALVYRSGGGNGVSDADMAALGSRVDALEKRPGAQAALADLSGKVAALQKQQSATPPQQAVAPGADPEMARKLAALQTSVDELRTQAGNSAGLDAKVAALEGAVAGMKSATATTQAGVANVEGQQKTLSDRVMVPALAVVADSLVQQIDRGEPYSAQVDALVSLGADPAKIAVLRENAGKGVPSAKILAAKFEPLAEPIAAASRKAAPNAGIVERLKTGMLSMVSVRRADDTSGDDLPSRVARIRADLAHDDIAGALATWDALPAEAKARGGDAWAALAKTSADALAAARGLQNDAIVALGAKRS